MLFSRQCYELDAKLEIRDFNVAFGGKKAIANDYYVKDAMYINNQDGTFTEHFHTDLISCNMHRLLKIWPQQ